MILTVNIGNTHLTVAAYRAGALLFSGKLSAAPATSDEYAIRLIHLLTLHHSAPGQIEGVMLASVVPALTGRVVAALRMLTSARIMTVGPGLKSGLKLRLDQPAQLGAELLCGVVAAMAEGPAPMAVIFSDTALTIMGVNAQKELVGGVILPGPQLSMASLVQNTAQLPQVDLTSPAPGVGAGQEHRRLPAGRSAAGHRLYAGRPGRPLPRRAGAPRPVFTPPATCPPICAKPAAPPSFIGRTWSPTGCTASGCGTGKPDSCHNYKKKSIRCRSADAFWLGSGRRIHQQRLDLGDAFAFGPQGFDVGDPRQAGLPFIAAGQVFAGLLKRQHPFLGCKISGVLYRTSVSRTSSPMVTYSACRMASMLLCLDI